ncbi:MAG: OmpH family outer membrane protein [Bacteroidaceae bacterium]|nr:OmpH family outer membrane protein [Bacteroidaceae bacterium]
MKKILFLAAIAACTLIGCNKNEQNADAGEAAATDTEMTTGVKIAYVELDSLMSQYKLYKDYSEVLQRKGANIQKTLAQKQKTLEQHAAALQKKYESNGFTTRDELERAQAGIQREQQDLAELAERLNGEFNAEQARVNEEARDSIQAFLKSYNKTKKYDYVMVKAGDNLLIANPKLDITQEVVKGLNKRYKGMKTE